MHPAFSILFFTTLIGLGQGIVVVLSLWVLAAQPIAPGILTTGLLIATALLTAGLAASFFHLGHKMRAWRAIAMWRTSWMSREVIILPLYIALVALWCLMSALRTSYAFHTLLPLVCLVASFVLWYCTAMIYACLKFIQEWASKFTVANFVLIGVSSGLLFTCAIAAVFNADHMIFTLGPLALIATLIALIVRWASVERNSMIKHLSNLQSATGLKAKKVVQKSMGMSAGSFNTREFFHGAKASSVRHVKFTFVALGFFLPALLAIGAVLTGEVWPWVLASCIQIPGLVAERWYFFAQAKHPQNLYYQVVS
jgi:sulfite dehydrogenase (quinone) subunit SoeC